LGKYTNKKGMMKMYYVKPTLTNLSQGARLEYIRKYRHMSADDVAEYFGFGGKDPHKTFNSYETNYRGPSKERLKECNNISIITDSHSNLDKYINNNIDLALFNLGFLPGSDKKISTNSYSTIIAIEKAYSLLNKDGIIIIIGYSRHPGGQKEIIDIENYFLDNNYKYTKETFDYENVFVIKKM
jgi:transcriptional regulator with XRE-family HTH domain